jgi:murein DD-endopeptidase MepM/ murein hydrolase activator NlpD
MVWLWLMGCGAKLESGEVQAPPPRSEAPASAPAREKARPQAELPFEVHPSERAPPYVPLFVPPYKQEGLKVSGTFDHQLPQDTEHRQLTGWGTYTYGKAGHHGHDVVMKVGTPLYAMAAGEVVLAGDQGPAKCDGGQVPTDIRVRIRHPVAPDGHEYETGYYHLSSSAVKVGDHVEQGQHIGDSGNTGCSSGPHLHFGVLRVVDRDKKKDSWAVDPWGWWSPEPDPWADKIGASPYMWIDAPPTQRRLQAGKAEAGVPLRFVSMVNASWRDNVLPNEEVLELSLAKKAEPRDLTGYAVRNRAGTVVPLPKGTRIEPGQTLAVHSGKGRTRGDEVHLGSEHGLFDDAFDCAELLDPSGEVVSSMPWGRKKEDPCGRS